MAVGFGFSVGDLVTALKVIKDSIEAIEDTKGASADYAAIVSEISCLQDGFEAIEDLQLTLNGAPKQRLALDRAIQACQDCIEEFLESIAKYQKHLQPGRKGFIASYRKIKWALCKKEDVASFRTKLERHTSSINMLLITFQAKGHNQVRDGKGSSALIVTNQVDSPDKLMLNMLKTLTTEQRHCFELLMHQNRELMRSVQDLHRLLQIQLAIPPQVLLQAPVILLDAFGKRAPFHLDFIDSLETFSAVLKIRFRQAGVKPAGLAKVDNREFALQESRQKRYIDLTEPWTLVMEPGQEVDMSMVFHRFACPPSTCPGCSKNNELEDGQTQWYVK